MLNTIKTLLKRTPLRLLRTYLIMSFGGQRSQSSESLILENLVIQIKPPKTFAEFGFHIQEFNCTKFVRDFRGLLIDGDSGAVGIAKRFLPKNVEAHSFFITLDNLNFIERFFEGQQLGVLSVDVDGNDYWFLDRLIRMKPAIIVVEYNASLGLNPISVPYDPKFIRHEKHVSGWYHGASLTAMAHLCERNGYDLVEVERDGVNAFFVRSDRRPHSMPRLTAANSYRENQMRNSWSHMNAAAQWHVIESMPFVTVTDL